MMNQAERLIKIFSYLKEHQTMSIHTICKLLQISRDTARRDILKLLEEGTVMRTYGGISLPVLQHTMKKYQDRLKDYSTEKEQIAEEALTWIKENEFYFFDASTTIRFLAEKVHQKISVFTHSLDNIEVLSAKENVEVRSLGGRLNQKHRYFYQPDCQQQLDRLHFNTTFLGACAIREDGIYYVEEDDTFIKQVVVKNSDRVILLTEYDKFNLSSYYKGASWDQINMIITNKQLSPHFIKIVADHKIQLIVV